MAKKRTIKKTAKVTPEKRAAARKAARVKKRRKKTALENVKEASAAIDAALKAVDGAIDDAGPGTVTVGLPDVEFRVHESAMPDPAQGTDLMSTAQMISVLEATSLKHITSGAILKASQRSLEHIGNMIDLRDAVCKRLLVVGLPGEKSEWDMALAK